MLSFTRVQVRLLMAAGLCLALSAAIQYAGARWAPPLVLVRAAQAPDRPGDAGTGGPQVSAPGGEEILSAGGEAGIAAGDGLSGGGSGRAGTKRDINQMGFDELIQLPGIGAVIAQRILDYRAAHGPFARLEQLLEVPGIGPARYRQLLDYVTVGTDPAEEAQSDTAAESKSDTAAESKSDTGAAGTGTGNGSGDAPGPGSSPARGGDEPGSLMVTQ